MDYLCGWDRKAVLEVSRYRLGLLDWDGSGSLWHGRRDV